MASTQVNIRTKKRRWDSNHSDISKNNNRSDFMPYVISRITPILVPVVTN